MPISDNTPFACSSKPSPVLAAKQVLRGLGRINVGYITSCREISHDELVGRHVIDSETGYNYGYRQSLLESLVRRLYSHPKPRLQNDGRIHDDDDSEHEHEDEKQIFEDLRRLINVTCVVMDDSDQQYEEAWACGALWPTDLPVVLHDNEPAVPLRDVTFRIPSCEFKKLRRDAAAGETPQQFAERKAAAKAAYERKLLDVLDRCRVDILISDSYVTIFGPTFLERYRGLTLNIHPAVTAVGDPDRLPGLTPSRDAYTRTMYGWVIVDDKLMVDLPEGPAIDVEFEGNRRKAVHVGKNPYSGVTVHVVSECVDNGCPVLTAKYNIVEKLSGVAGNPALSQQAIRNQNYRLKHRVMPEALLLHIRNPNTAVLINNLHQAREAASSSS